MNSRVFLVPAICVLFVSLCLADEYRVEVLDEAPPLDDASDSLRQQFTKTGLKVIRGSNRTVCELWPCRQWQAPDGFQPSAERLYPFQRGQLVGLLRLRRRGNDFRDQQISRGVYTLRYGLQPIDGNHEGTSPTRDFLVLVKIEEDSLEKQWTVESLMEASATAAESNHPAMLCLQQAKAQRKAASMRHNQEYDWWILQLAGEAVSGASTRPLPVDIVVVGHAEE